MSIKYFKNKRAYVMAFLFPVMAMLLIFFFREIYPFGDESFLRTDMYHQYAPFSSEFIYKLQHGGSLLYTWDVGLGVNFTALYAYYLASPLNWLMVLCPKGLIIEFMTYMIVFKIGLCGVTMCYYLRHHFINDDLGSAFFAVCYALSGYVAAYSWNWMWLDCIVLFPLIMLGLERLVRGESGMLYVISLGLSILSNYYISIMICIFMVVYFIYLNFFEGLESFQSVLVRSIRFGIYSVIAGGLAAVTLLPEIFALQLTASGDFNFPKTVQQYFTIIDMIARQMPLVETEQGLDHWPNIYAGSMVFIMLPMYFMNRTIRMRDKAVNGVLLIFFFLSFSINILNFIWHGFHFPNSLPCRQSFIYIFIVLYMCYEAYIKRHNAEIKEIGAALFTAVAFILLAQKIVTDDAFKWYTFYVTLLFVLIYYGFLYVDRLRKWDRGILVILISFVLFVELTINVAVTSVPTTSRVSYTEDNQDVIRLVSEVREQDNSFYRFEKMTRKTKDDGAWMNFPSVSLFSSTAYSACSDFFKSMGMEASTNAYSITGSTPLMNMLLAVKYSIYSKEVKKPEELSLKLLNSSGDTYMYENAYALPLGFMLSDKELSSWYTDMAIPALNQNSLCDALETNPVLISEIGDPNGKKYSFTASVPGDYYAYITESSIKDVSVDFGSRTTKVKNVNRGYYVELGYLDTGYSVTLTNETNDKALTLDILRFDFTALKEVFDKLNDEGWNPTTIEDTYLSGDITANNDGTMMTSIPYDEGWTVYVDGAKQDPVKVKDTFIGVKLTAGTHKVEMKYFPKGLKEGAAISGLSILALLLIALFTKKFGYLERLLPEHLEEEEDENELEAEDDVEDVDTENDVSRKKTKDESEDQIEELLEETIEELEEVEKSDHEASSCDLPQNIEIQDVIDGTIEE